MVRLRGAFVLVCVLFVEVCVGAADDFIIRRAIADDIAAIMIVDREVTVDFFVPLFTRVSPFLALSSDEKYAFAREWMESMMKNDEHEIPSIIGGDGGRQALYVACERTTKAIVGFVILNYDASLRAALVELLEVSAAVRGRSLGSLLVDAVWDAFPGAYHCYVYPINHEENAPVLRFYQRLGFVPASVDHIERARVFSLQL